ncbi:4-hydroxy-tetrahydrodipicolinate reductase [Eubacteriales bacterium OttesenSCG-928-G02]|nr:4-hydroxy-tetrahydrodipicolinate reductase [Eubacteriales bacterium OttesenSCG-928-G02]
MKIILSGINGRMGKTVCDCAKLRGFEVVAGSGLPGTHDHTIPFYENVADITEKADVLLDFSHHSQTKAVLEYAVSKKIPVVISTTGQTNEEIEMIISYSKKHPVFYSRNMSLGIATLCELVKNAAKILGENFDIEIIEMHHNKKLDAPSGTALMIYEELRSVLDYEPNIAGDRSKVREARKPQEIGIHAVRGGSIIGEHEVLFCGNGETIRVSHSAQGREVFAEGALRACEFMLSCGNGLYTMKEVLEHAKNMAVIN